MLAFFWIFIGLEIASLFTSRECSFHVHSNNYLMNNFITFSPTILSVNYYWLKGLYTYTDINISIKLIAACFLKNDWCSRTYLLEIPWTISGSFEWPFAWILIKTESFHLESLASMITILCNHINSSIMVENKVPVENKEDIWFISPFEKEFPEIWINFCFTKPLASS